jgi:bifunctional UDP-N-acetylglucosamine pyrophosphorylase / glucosamine-1-phosphate N-acetyltransferase
MRLEGEFRIVSISSQAVGLTSGATAIHAVILAAGLGTRMRSAKAKVLHEAGGLTMAELIVRQTLRIVVDEHIHVIVGHQAAEVEQVLTPYGVRFGLQAEQKGTGHAVLCVRDALEAEPGLLLIINGDCPLLRAETLTPLMEAMANPDVAGAILTTVLPDATGYGRIVRDARDTLQAIVEEKAASAAEKDIREINTGIYCFRAESFWPALLAVRPDNPAGEYYLTDVVKILHQQGGVLLPVVVPDPAEVLGVNNRLELATADRFLRERKAKELMLDGVTLEKPETITIDEDVTVGPDTVIEAFAQLRGNSTIGAGSRIGAGSILRNVTLGAGSHVLPYSVVEDTVAGERVHVGPFARLRNGNLLGDQVRIGNFVELKKTTMHHGAKANHLAYLGDSTVGSSSNVGAGTITCNYDGIHKHATTIGQGCFIGSNSTLVAPLDVGDHSYVAAGSVITQTVPANSLAFGRARQAVKEDGAEMVRSKAQQRDTKPSK